MSLVSVIIPTYNRANVIGSAINSALNQTYKNVEIIVVDDGSTDGTADYVTEFGYKIKYIFKENGGVSSARNLGIRNSSGNLIAFLDSDDEWILNKLEKQIQFLNKYPDIGMVLCDCYYMDSNRNITEMSHRRNRLPRDGYILSDVFLSPSLIPSSVLIKKDVLDDVGYFDEDIKTAEDLDLHLRIARKHQIGLIAEPLFNYMVGHDGLSSLSRTYDDHVYVVERFIKKHPKMLDELLIQKTLINTYSCAANGKYWLNEWHMGNRYAFKASKYIRSFNDVLVVGKIWAKGIKYFVKGLKSKLHSDEAVQ